ncbi:MAG TPA: hypothetical protein VGK00_17475 [Anaerolineales bacterium]|jgi:hypothetical protein
MIPSSAPTNRLALVSFIFAGLTLLSLCTGAVPIPMTAWVCYPSALLLGAVAVLTGARALRQLRSSAEKGRGLALLSIWTGALSMLAVLFFTAVTAIILYYGLDALSVLWSHYHP